MAIGVFTGSEGYHEETETKIYTKTEMRLEVNRQTKHLKDQNSYLLKVIDDLEKKLDNQKT